MVQGCFAPPLKRGGREGFLPSVTQTRPDFRAFGRSRTGPRMFCRLLRSTGKNGQNRNIQISAKRATASCVAPCISSTLRREVWPLFRLAPAGHISLAPHQGAIAFEGFDEKRLFFRAQVFHQRREHRTVISCRRRRR
jgi:hypothetical protein